MEGIQARSSMNFLAFWGRGNATNAAQHGFIYESTWNSRRKAIPSKLIEFHGTLHGRDLQRYMKLIK